MAVSVFRNGKSIFANPPRSEALGGAFEGASRTSSEIASWNPSLLSADNEVTGSKSITDARARDLSRNDGYIAGAVDVHKDSIVGAQFTLNSKPNLQVLSSIDSRFTPEWVEEFQKSVEAQFHLYADSPECYIDAQGVNNFTSLIRLAVGVCLLSGEVLASAEYIRENNRPFRTAIQMIDTDRLSNPNNAEDTKSLVGGIFKNKFGKPRSYHILNGHPSDWSLQVWKEVKARLPWGRKNIIHIFDQQRAGQTRGVSKLVSILKSMKMAKKYKEIVLQNAVMNASFAATIESELPANTTMAQLGSGDSASGTPESYMNDVLAYNKSSQLKIDGARVQHLWPGQKLNLQNAGSPNGVGDKFEQSLLSHVAAPLGLSAEQFTKDFTQTNFASAKAAMAETKRYMMSQKKLTADSFATQIYVLWFEEALNSGFLPLPEGVDKGIFYVGQVKDALTACSWIGASEGSLDPKKEIETAILKIQNNLSTYEIEAAKFGNDFRDIFAQRQRENKVLVDRGLPLIGQLTDDGEQDATEERA
jgi:lambda family phage portal protein